MLETVHQCAMVNLTIVENDWAETVAIMDSKFNLYVRIKFENLTQDVVLDALKHALQMYSEYIPTYMRETEIEYLKNSNFYKKLATH